MSSSSKVSVDGVIIISCNGLSSENVIQKILSVDILPTASIYGDSTKGYEWKVDTKYYSAVVNLYSVQEKTDFVADFCDTIQAVVFYFNGKEPSNFEDVMNWMPSLNDINSEVQLLVCDTCSSEETHKKNVLNWCVANQFELIELDEVDGSDSEEENAFPKAKGYDRIIEALQSHTWSNLVMKKSTKQQADLVKDENELSAKSSSDLSCSSISEKNTDSSRKVKVDDEELLLEEHLLEKVLKQDDPDGESFEALFSKFASMKDKATGLNGEDRKKYAEEVAIAFWRAMGGEEDEIEGLDDE